MKQSVIGVIGQGFVGSSVKIGFENYYTVETYDLISEKSTKKSARDLIWDSDIIFVCLPTPMRKDGSCDIRIIESTLKEINECLVETNKNKLVITKSTVPPQTHDSWSSKYRNLDLVFNPEFLTEANAAEDFKNQNRIILGGHPSNCTKAKEIFEKVFPDVDYFCTTFTTSELIKYFINCFLASKVSFANEFYQICDSLGADYSRVVSGALLDKRIGTSHLSVPGPDGDFGFGGHCFPKDLNAMIHTAEKLDIDPTILKATKLKNTEVRNNKDWEAMKGRAVSDD